MADSMDGLNKDIPYDLRQIYAVELLGEHLKDVARARKNDNFSMYFKCLKDVWIVSQHKFKDKDIKYKALDKNKQSIDVTVKVKEYYTLLMNNVVSIANKNKQEWLGQSKDPAKCAELEHSLNTVEMFLYDQIEQAKIFGSSKHIPGL